MLAILDASVGVLKVSAASIPQTVQWAVAEQTAECLRIGAFVAGEILTLPMLEKVIIWHDLSSRYLHGKKLCGILKVGMKQRPRVLTGRLFGKLHPFSCQRVIETDSV